MSIDRRQEEPNRQLRDYATGIGIVVGVGTGLLFWMMFENFSVIVGAGVAAGLLIGSVIQLQRPTTKERGLAASLPSRESTPDFSTANKG